jgi:uncharacterized protein (TIGR00299 family) protein
MILGALIDAGVDREKLVRADRSGIAAAKAQVKVSHEHTARNLRDIELLISESTLSETVKSRAIQIFLRLGEAEARVHGIEIEKVHFHEVGAMDSIIDVVGCCVGFEMLGVEQFVSSKINVGHGFVKMGHGTFPVPPPAVAELLKGIPFYSNDVEGELTTPTGAAIISTLCDSYGLMPELTAEAVGYGAGTREYNGFPNVIRIIVGEAAAHVCMTNRERLVLLETNLDDLSPQISGYVVDHALQSGALDCWLTPIYMKKNRPAALLSVLCRESDRNALSEMIFRETSTLGIRAREVEREFLGREVVTVSTNFGDVAVKLGRIGEEIVNVMPEYENVKSLAIKHKVPFIEIRDAVLRAWETAREPKSEKANA